MRAVSSLLFLLACGGCLALDKVHIVPRNPQGLFIQPEIERELTDVPRVPSNKTYIFYMVYHDEESKAEALRIARPWIKPLFVPSTYLFENFAHHIIGTRRHEWGHLDYVGLLTYQAERRMPGLLDRIEFIMRELWDYRLDVLLWNEEDIHFDLYDQAVRHVTGNFSVAWELWMRGAGLEELANRQSPTRRAVLVFYNNFFALTPSLYAEYVKFFTIMAARMEHDEALREVLFETDTGYGDASRNRLSADRLIEMTGRPYYTLHPFLLERLPGAFFSLKKSRVFCNNVGIILDLAHFQQMPPEKRKSYVEGLESNNKEL